MHSKKWNGWRTSNHHGQPGAKAGAKGASEMKIEYSYLDEQRREHVAAWEGERQDALAAAVAHLRAERSEDDASEYIYEDDGSLWAVDEDALVVLGAALLGHGDRDDVYSLWCAAHPSREISGPLFRIGDAGR
jgi:hypothetical protein